MAWAICGHCGEAEPDKVAQPYGWLRCELDAAYFQLYGIERDDFDYIMETFPIIKRKDQAAHGGYRTKHVILAIHGTSQSPCVDKR